MIEKEKINELLKKVREDTGSSQKIACKDIMDRPSYSRVENGTRKVDFEEIVAILSNMSVSLEEFVTVYVRPEIEETVRFYFRRLVKSLPSEQAFSEIMSLYNNLAERYPDLRYDELGVYFDIKTYFHRTYPDKVKAITKEELRFIVKNFKQNVRQRYFSEDYRLLAHTIMNMSSNEIVDIIDVIFPIEDTVYLTEQSIRSLNQLFLNAITPMLKLKEYGVAKKLIDVAKEHEFLYVESHYFRWNLIYLENMYLFLVTNDWNKLKVVNTFIDMLDQLGETNYSTELKKEVEGLLKGCGGDKISEHPIVIAKM